MRKTFKGNTEESRE